MCNYSLDHPKGLEAFKQEYKAARYLLVSLDTGPRRTEDGIDILPWDVFLEQLWSGKLVH